MNRLLINLLLTMGYLAGFVFVWAGVELFILEHASLAGVVLAWAFGIGLWAFLVWVGRYLRGDRVFGHWGRRTFRAVVIIAAAWVMGGVPIFVHELGEELVHWQTLGGGWEELSEFTLLFPASMCLIWIVFATLFVMYREMQLPHRADHDLTVAVVVPAHNEELVIAQTLEGLLNQSYKHLEIHVVSDGSTDATVDIAQQYASQGVIIHDLQPHRGKSGALQYVLERVHTDLFMIVDSDTIPDRRAVHYMVQQFVDPRIAGVTGSPYVRNITNPLLAMQAMEYCGIIGLLKRADSFWGGLYTVSGAAACFRSETLRKVGGWIAPTVTEDIEISWRLQKAGHELAYEPRALFAIQAPKTLRSLYRQRSRWAQGMAEVLRIHRDVLTTANAALIPIVVQLVSTAVWMLLLLVGIVHLGWLMWLNGLAVEVPRLASVGHVFVFTLGLLLAQTILAATFDRHYRRRTYRLIPLAALYPIYYWLVIAPCYLLGVARGLFVRYQTHQWGRTVRVAEE